MKNNYQKYLIYQSQTKIKSKIITFKSETITISSAKDLHTRLTV